VETEGTTVLDGDAGQLDRWAAIHHDLQAGVERALRGGLIHDAELQPHRPDSRGDRLVDVRARLIGAAEDVDDLNALLGGNRRDGG
jgi:hypothetical protein